jgi:hypothetical protein
MSPHCNQRMAYSKDQLIDALQNEYEYLCHDDFDPETDMSMEQHLEWLRTLTLEELIAETGTYEEFTMNEFMDRYHRT